MPYYSLVDLDGANGQRLFTFSFPYIDGTHIHVYSDGIETTDFTFDSTYVIRLDTVLAGPHTIRISRITPIDAALVDFQNGSSLNETDLDSVTLQMLYIAQEHADYLTTGQIIALTTANTWDAQNNRIINVGTPTGVNDAATKYYVDQSFSSSGNGHAIGAHVDAVSTSLVKGDLLVVTDQGSGVYKYDKQGIGINGQVLLANSVANTGMSWSNVAIDAAAAIAQVYNRANNTLVQVDMGTDGNTEWLFTVTDANVTTSSLITGTVAYVAPDGKDLDEVDMDSISLKFGGDTGQVLIYVSTLEGPVAGNVKIIYHVG